MISLDHSPLSMFLADGLDSLTTPVIATMAGIVVIGLLLGIKDVLRFSPRRIWALSSLAFSESLRRRILLVTPLAILGVILVAQFSRPTDEQDAIRQILKFCMFASGMLVTIVAIMLACTSLPREVENRVIYTIVTKPTTRLEIVLGKALGFGRVSAMILLIMGLFTWGYLQVTSWRLSSVIQARLQSNDPSLVASRNALEHYATAGLLNARELTQPSFMQELARPPEGDVRWILGESQQEIDVPFYYSESQLLDNDLSSASHTAIYLEMDVMSQALSNDIGDQNEMSDLSLPNLEGPKIPGPVMQPPSPLVQSVTPRISVNFLGQDFTPLFEEAKLTSRGNLFFVPADGKTKTISIFINPDMYGQIYAAGSFHVRIMGVNRNVIYGVKAPIDGNPSPIRLVMVDTQTGKGRQLDPRISDNAGKGVPLAFRGHRVRSGHSIPGGDPATNAVAIYHFQNAIPQGIAPTGQVPFELRMGVDFIDSSAESDENPTQVQVSVRPAGSLLMTESKDLAPPVTFVVDPSHTSYFTMPASVVSSGQFDLYVQCLNADRSITLNPGSLTMVLAEHSFAWNLVKSMFVLWLLAMLVVCISICCSTFVSWPIAIILTMVILLGRWSVQQLGDYDPGLAHQVANDLFPRGAAKAQVVSTTVGAMNKLMHQLAEVLPDIGPYSSTDQLEQGRSLTPDAVIVPLASTAVFALPMLVLAFVFLRYKEVAP